MEVKEVKNILLRQSPIKDLISCCIISLNSNFQNGCFEVCYVE